MICIFVVPCMFFSVYYHTYADMSWAVLHAFYVDMLNGDIRFAYPLHTMYTKCRCFEVRHMYMSCLLEVASTSSSQPLYLDAYGSDEIRTL